MKYPNPIPAADLCCGPVPCLVLKQGPELPKEPHQLEDEFLSEDEDEEEELPRD